MSQTITGYNTMTQTLSPAAPAVSITGTINANGAAGVYALPLGHSGVPQSETFGAAVFGPAAGSFTITNSATISVPGATSDPFDAGIVLGGAGSVGNDGTIAGGSGIAIIGASSASYIENSGLIIGQAGVGVVVFSGAGTVFNDGTITGGSDGAIALFGGGFASNSVGGLLTGGSGGNQSYVVQAQANATVINAGTISGQYGGIGLKAGGLAINTGLIAATGTGFGPEFGSLSLAFYGGIKATSGSTVVNTGSITGQNGIYVSDNYGSAGSLSGGSYVRNAGVIDAASTYPLRVTAASNVGLFGTGIEFLVAGTVVNAGTISASNAGIYTQNGIANVTNSGFITVTSTATGQDGIFLGDGLPGGGTSGVSGFVYNRGTVAAYSTVSVTGNQNTGFDQSGVGVYLAGAGTVVNTGSIYGNHVGIVVESGLGTVINSGLITEASGADVAGATPGYGIYLKDGGSVTNTGTILGAGQGIFAGGSFNIDNSGYVAASTKPFTEGGRYTYISDAIFGLGTGNITNTASGTVTAKYGVGIVLDGVTLNSLVGSVVSVPATLVNAGTVIAAYAVEFGGIGSINNSGQILGQAWGVKLIDNFTGASVGTLVNSGLIQALQGMFTEVTGTAVSGTGVILTGGDIINLARGTITGAIGVSSSDIVPATSYAAAQYISNPFYLNNAGLISGATTAVYASGVSATIINSGLLSGAYGVYFKDGGTLTNSGTINAVDYGVDAQGSLNVTNTGVIESTSRHFVNPEGRTTGGAGILLGSSATVTNAAGAIITGYNGISTYKAPVSIYNAGSIIGAGTYSGIFLGGGGLVANSGTIIAASAAAVYALAATTINNTGVIIATGNGEGIGLQAGGTVTNSGTINGGFGDAVRFAAGAENRMIVDPGAVFGTPPIPGLVTFGDLVDGGDALGSTGSSVLELAAGTGTLSGDFVGFQTLQFDQGAAWLVNSGNDYFIDGQTITGFGLGDTLVIDDNSFASATYVAGAGLELSNGDGTITLDILGSLSTDDFLVSTDGVKTTISETLISAVTLAPGTSGTIAAGETVSNPVIAGGELAISSGGSVAGAIAFSGTGSTLIIEPDAYGTTTVPSNTITGFAPGDTIELGGVPYDASEDSYTVATAGTLTVDADGTYYNLEIAGAYVGETNFVLSNDIQITEVTCYVEGTRILTTQGEVEVENLAIGDMLPTLHGGAKRIKWIGVRGYDGRFIAGNKIALPICIKAGALGSGIPARDLWVSPGHAICFGDALVHASRLVNGVSIIQAEAVEQVTYYHIEMESHEIIFAENCPAETFMDEHFRQQFHNAAGYEALYPGEQAPQVACLPRLDDGFQLHGIQSEINHRAGIAIPELDGPVRGYVDAAGARVCSGWAQWALHPEVPVCLDILAGGKLIGNVLANRYRADVHAAGYGSGFHGFEFLLPEGCSGALEVRQTGGGAFLAIAGRQEAA